MNCKKNRKKFTFKGKMNETFYHKLSNGVQIVHRKTHSPVVYVGLMIGAGTRHEQTNENGMAHYIEHCVFKGTAHYTARQIINHIEGIGGEINAYTTKEETTFYAATLSNHFRTTLHLLADMVLRPTFNKKETDKEVAVILDEIESYNDSPSELIYDDFENMIFEGSSLAMPILGTKKTLKRIAKSSYLLQCNHLLPQSHDPKQTSCSRRLCRSCIRHSYQNRTYYRWMSDKNNR
jgi:predicted Zn-dependent peptidase